MRSVVLVLSLCFVIAGCDKAEDGVGSEVGVISLFDPAAVNPSLCGGPAIPFPNNALFSSTTDGTLNIPNPAGAPFVTAANLTDGFSTTASIFTDVLGAVDYATAADAIVILETDSDPVTPGPQPRILVPGVDFTVQPSLAMATVSGTGTATGTCTSTGIPQKFLPISQQRSRILIEPLKPLLPSTTYIVAVTTDLQSSDGVPALPNEFFPIVNQDERLCRLAPGGVLEDAVGTELACTDAAAPAEAAARLEAPVLTTMVAAIANPTGGPPAILTGASAAAVRMTTLETLRRTLLRPTVTTFKALAGAAGQTVEDEDLVIAWSFTTESIGLTLSRLDTSAPAAAFQVANTTLSTGDLGVPGLSDYADIWAGIIQVPYYLKNTSGGVTDPVLDSTWESDGTLNATSPPALGGAVPCSALAPSFSTTICRPDPAVQSTETIPVLVTVPNNNVCAPNPALCAIGDTGVVDKPAAGWPVVVFQHGITRDRTDMFALAPTLAAAGFVVVSIDQPLHGITNAASPFYRNQLFNSTPAAGLQTSSERTFDLDLLDNTPAANPAIPTPANPCVAANNAPDMVSDSSGTHFVNLQNLAIARDNLRQSEADLLHLVRSIGALDLDQNPGALTVDDIDETRIRFVGQSLGAIVGTTVMGLDIGGDAAADGTDELVGAAALNVPGGGLGKLLDASASFGPRIAAGLACSFVHEGTDTYETFVRFAQHLIDPADPINYAAAANANHPLLVTEVIGDAVVPNNAASTCPAVSALTNPLTNSAAAVDPPGTPAASGPVSIAQVTASGVAGASLLAQCPPLVLAADPPLAAITYQDETAIAGHLSGTDALVDVMGIANSVAMGSAPFAAQPNETGDTFVVFAPDTAEHGTLLTPNASSLDGDMDGSFSDSDDAQFAPATCAQQKQTATFLASNGALLPIGGTCP